MRRRFYLLTTDFKPKLGGIADYLHGIFDQMGREGPVRVVSLGVGDGSTWGHSYDLEEVPDLDRAVGSMPGDGFWLGRKLNSFRYKRARLERVRSCVERIARELRPDDYLTIGVWDQTSHEWCRELERKGIPYALFAYGREVVRPVSARWAERRRRDFAVATAIFPCSRASGELVQSELDPPGPVYPVLPASRLSYDPDVLQRRADELRGELGVPPDARVVASIARLVKRKGVDVVLEGVSRVRHRHPDTYHVIVGHGPQSERLEALARELQIEDRVRTLGRVSDFDKWAVLQMCDVFALANSTLERTDWEGFGNVFLEASVVGRAAIGGKTGGVPEAIDQGVTGYTVDPNQVQEMADALDRLLSDGALRKQFGTAARERAARKFTWSHSARAFRAGAQASMPTTVSESLEIPL